MTDCNYYDAELDCCKRFSDWSSPMPILQPCIESPCEHYFHFDYGVVVYKHRFSINRSLDDYKEITLHKCIRMGIQYKYKTMARDKLIAEMQIVYKDENGKLHCLCEDLSEYTFEIKHKGDMKIQL